MDWSRSHWTEGVQRFSDGVSVHFSFQRLSSSITAAARVIAIISAALVASSAKTRPLLKMTLRRFSRQLQREVVEMQRGRLTRVVFS